MRNAHLCVIALALLAGIPALAANTTLLPGRWELTIRTESPVATAPMTTEFCLSQKKAEKLEPPKNDDKQDCKVTSGGLNGNVLSYVTKCGKRNGNSTARFTFNGDHYEGVVESTLDGVTTRQVYSARRLGNCPEEESVPQP